LEQFVFECESQALFHALPPGAFNTGFNVRHPTLRPPDLPAGFFFAALL